MYWIQVLKRVIAIVKFLSSRGLTFRGGYSELFGCTKNGNYLGFHELLSNFDPFLEEHIKEYGNPGKGKLSYTICNEFIDILATTVNLKIVSEIKETKYFVIIILLLIRYPT